MNKINSNFAGQNIYVGMDIHKASWNLGIHLNDMFVKNVHQKPSPSIMAGYLKQHYPGAHYKAVFEAGKFGFWIQRQLTALGIECLVVNPADIPKSQKDTLQKTNPRDARNLAMRRQSGVLKSIHIPDEQQEADRVFFRHASLIGFYLSTDSINPAIIKFGYKFTGNQQVMPLTYFPNFRTT